MLEKYIKFSGLASELKAGQTLTEGGDNDFPLEIKHCSREDFANMGAERIYDQ